MRIQVSRYPVSRYSQLARASFAIGRPGHLALVLCAQDDQLSLLGEDCWEVIVIVLGIELHLVGFRLP